jgi:hypothetical protein
MKDFKPLNRGKKEEIYIREGVVAFNGNIENEQAESITIHDNGWVSYIPKTTQGRERVYEPPNTVEEVREK